LKASFCRTPTAHARPSAAATPKRVLKFGPAFGVRETVHWVPSKCSANVRVASWLLFGASGRRASQRSRAAVTAA
jgi:hypothetical protein